MNKWPGAPFLGYLHPAGAQNKTLISNTATGFRSHYNVQITIQGVAAGMKAALFGISPDIGCQTGSSKGSTSSITRLPEVGQVNSGSHLPEWAGKIPQQNPTVSL